VDETNQYFVRPAGFWRRVSATLIDFAIVFMLAIGSLNAIKGYVEKSGLQIANETAILGICFAILLVPYYLLFNVLFRTTIGKLILRLKIVDAEGKRMGFGKALVRSFGYLVSVFILFGGFLFIVGNQKKRALHDIMSGTFVVFKSRRESAMTIGPVWQNLIAKLKEIKKDPKRRLRFLYSAAAVVIAIVVFGYSAVIGVMAYRASSEIKTADKAVTRAALASERGTDITDLVLVAKGNLKDSKSAYKVASFVAPSEFNKAYRAASKTVLIANSVNAKVRKELADANKSALNDAMGFLELFKFYNKYPRTPEAKKALEYARAAIEDNSTKHDKTPHIGIQIMFDFAKNYPDDKKPDYLSAVSKPLFTAYADSLLAELQLIVDDNMRWVQEIRSGDTTKKGLRAQSSNDQETVSMALSSLDMISQSPEYKSVYSLLVDASGYAMGFNDIDDNPSAMDGSTKLFNSSQIGQVEEMSNVLQGKIAGAKAIWDGMAK
jgi:uncharacterized RDD family membrane protein YckC